MRYIKGLDTVRAFAVLTVIIWHWYNPPLRTMMGFITHWFMPTGLFGVDLFFVLSGYLITSILLNAKRESSNHLGIIKNFIIRRALRIFPIYYLLIIVLIVCKFPFGEGTLPYYLTYTSNFLSFTNGWNNFSHTWSLAVEEQFYLIWPWLILYIKEQYTKYIFLFCIIIATISKIVTVAVFHVHFQVLMTSCFDAFGIGGLYAWCQLNEKDLRKFIKCLNIIFPIAVIIYFIWKLYPYYNIFAASMMFERTINSIISVWIIHSVINVKQGPIKSVLENKLLITIGKISYGLYLFHYVTPFFFRMIKDDLAKNLPHFKGLIYNNYFSTPMMFIFLFIMAYLSFELFEKRITNLKTKFKYTIKIPRKSNPS